MNLLGVGSCIVAVFATAAFGDTTVASKDAGGFVPAAPDMTASYATDGQPSSYLGEPAALFVSTNADGQCIVTKFEFRTHATTELAGLSWRFNAVCGNRDVEAFQAAPSGDFAAWVVRDREGKILRVACSSIDGNQFRTWTCMGFMPQIYWLPDGNRFACLTSSTVRVSPDVMQIFSPTRPKALRKFSVPPLVVLRRSNWVRGQSSVLAVQADNYLLTAGVVGTGTEIPIDLSGNICCSVLSPRRAFSTVRTYNLAFAKGGMLEGATVSPHRERIAWTISFVDRTELWLTDSTGMNGRCLGRADRSHTIQDVVWQPSGKSMRLWDGLRVWEMRVDELAAPARN